MNFANAASTGPQQIVNNQLVHQANFNASHFSAIGIGTTLYFQASYTDPGQAVSSNFSDGLQITFQQETSPSIGFQGTSSSAIESIGTASIGMQVSSASGLPISVEVQYSGSATRGVDFNGPDSLTLSPGQTVLNLDIQVLSDALYEFDEQVVIDLIGVTNAQPGSLLQHVLTLTNDDPQPTVEFQSATSSSAESEAGDSVGVMMSAPSGIALELPYTLSGTALLGLDYTDPGGGLLTIPAGVTFASLPLTWVADGLDEPTETIAIQLGTPVNGTLGTQQDHVLSLLDSDPEPTVSFVVGSSSHLENAGSVSVQIQLSQPSGFDISVPFSISGSATQGADFGVSPSPMTLLAGTTSVEVLIALSDDLLDEADETVVLTLGAASHAVLGAPTVHVLRIEDDDLPPQVRFLQASSSETEGTTGDRVIGLEITSLSGLDVSIELSLTGTASNGVDYVAPGGTVLISAGSLSGQVVLPVLDDALDELDETIELNLTLAVNAVLGSPAVHVHTILDDDATPTPGFVLANSDLNEGQSDLVEVSLTAISGLDVPFALGARGSAVSGSDYTPLATTHVIPAGSLVLGVPVETLTDGLHEGDETIAITIPVGATPGAESHALLIQDQDAPPAVQFAAGTSEIREDHGVLVLPLVLSGPSAFDLTLVYALSGGAQEGAGGDFLDLGQGVVTISAFETTGKIGLEILQDGLFEYREDLVLDLMSVNPGTIGALSQHLVALVDDDSKPRVSFATAGASYLEGAGVVNVDLVLEGPASFDLPVAYTFQGTLSEGLDFQIRGGGMVRIPAGQSTASFQVELLGDLIDELDEELVLRLMPGDDALIGDQQEFLLVALDDDAPPVIAFDAASASALESAGSQLIGMSLNAPSGLNVTGSVSLGGTAIDGSDFSFGATTFTIPAGSLSADLTLTPVDDPIDELGETVEVTLGGVGNAVIGTPSVHTFTLLDDDAAPVVQFDLASSAVLEGAGAH
ncbi:MAG: hypothetical protein OSB42_04770, partial [Planctomycetota bacterium]|nr:hypothetical protein [Planctomycetota bacterium]